MTLSGHDLLSLDPSFVRSRMALVAQEPVLWATTIRENICYGARSAGLQVRDADVLEAAKMANAEGFIMGFPEGFDTLVGERGVRLSGGQKQRIAIARSSAPPRRHHHHARPPGRSTSPCLV